MALIAAHAVLALVLFKLVNWIGEHATDFGYASTTLFEEPNNSLALNFFIRALAPAVFMVALSAAAVAAGYPDLRIGIYWIAIFYYVFRAGYIVLVNMSRLVSWPRFLFHSAIGLSAAWLVYQSLILPNRSLLPNLETAGNELWLAIMAFLYAAANKASVPSGPGARRRNAFIKRSFDRAEFLYGPLIVQRIPDEKLQLVAYSILIYEGYCRPPLLRMVERLLVWKKDRTTGIMQVASPSALTDAQSVELGTQKLATSWQHYSCEDLRTRVESTIHDYNKDRDYSNRVWEVMGILAKRAAPRFGPAYDTVSQWNAIEPSADGFADYQI